MVNRSRVLCNNYLEGFFTHIFTKIGLASIVVYSLSLLCRCFSMVINSIACTQTLFYFSFRSFRARETSAEREKEKFSFPHHHALSTNRLSTVVLSILTTVLILKWIIYNYSTVGDLHCVHIRWSELRSDWIIKWPTGTISASLRWKRIFPSFLGGNII